MKHVRERGVVEASVLAAELRRLGPELDPCFARFANEFVAPHSADFDVVVAAKGAVLSVRPSHGKRLEPLDQCMIPVLRTLRIPTPPRGGVVTVAFRSAGLTTHADRPRFGRGQVD